MVGGGAPPALGDGRHPPERVGGGGPRRARRRFAFEHAWREPRLRGIVAMEGAALDKGLVPEFEGITDAATIADWDLPFPMDLKRIRPKDEAYWRQYRAAPKAFLALDIVRSFWPGTQRGMALPDDGVTSVALVPPKGMTLEAAAERFESAFRRRDRRPSSAWPFSRCARRRWRRRKARRISA